jgi:hypothetical protein
MCVRERWVAHAHSTRRGVVVHLAPRLVWSVCVGAMCSRPRGPRTASKRHSPPRPACENVPLRSTPIPRLPIDPLSSDWECLTLCWRAMAAADPDAINVSARDTSAVVSHLHHHSLVPVSASPLVRVVVKTLTDKTYPFVVYKTAAAAAAAPPHPGGEPRIVTVEDLKRAMHAREGIPVEQQRVFFASVELEVRMAAWGRRVSPGCSRQAVKRTPTLMHAGPSPLGGGLRSGRWRHHPSGAEAEG